MRDPQFRQGFARFARLGLSFESWQYHQLPPDAIDLSRSFPDTTITLIHVGNVLGVGPYAGRRQRDARWLVSSRDSLRAVYIRRAHLDG